METLSGIKEKLKKPIGLVFLIPVLILGAFFAFPFIVGMAIYAPVLLYYLVFCLLVQAIAKKIGIKHSWFAWLPIFQLYLLCKMAGESGLAVLLFFIPILNFIEWVIVWREIALTRKMDPVTSTITGLLMLVPFIQLLLLIEMARGPKSFEKT